MSFWDRLFGKKPSGFSRKTCKDCDFYRTKKGFFGFCLESQTNLITDFGGLCETFPSQSTQDEVKGSIEGLPDELPTEIAYYEEPDILRGEDNTEVNNDSATTDWILAKTIQIFGMTESKYMNRLLYECKKAAGAGAVYVRITTRVFPADPIIQVEEEVTTLFYAEGVKVKEIEPVYGSFTEIYVYLKGDGSFLNAVYNRQMQGFGSTKLQVSYT